MKVYSQNTPPFRTCIGVVAVQIITQWHVCHNEPFPLGVYEPEEKRVSRAVRMTVKFTLDTLFLNG